jgi:membrane-bound inhibitor of C-type lysozyme
MMNKEESTTPRLGAALAWLMAVPLLSACAGGGAEVTALPARIDYVCAKERTLSVARTEGLRVAHVLVDGREIILPRSASAAQEKYSDGRHSLYLDGENAMLEEQGRVLYGPCVSPVPLPTYYR